MLLETDIFWGFKWDSRCPSTIEIDGDGRDIT